MFFCGDKSYLNNDSTLRQQNKLKTAFILITLKSGQVILFFYKISLKIKFKLNKFKNKLNNKFNKELINKE